MIDMILLPVFCSVVFVAGELYCAIIALTLEVWILQTVTLLGNW